MAGWRAAREKGHPDFVCGCWEKKKKEISGFKRRGGASSFLALYLLNVLRLYRRRDTFKEPRLEIISLKVLWVFLTERIVKGACLETYFRSCYFSVLIVIFHRQWYLNRIKKLGLTWDPSTARLWRSVPIPISWPHDIDCGTNRRFSRDGIRLKKIHGQIKYRPKIQYRVWGRRIIFAHKIIRKVEKTVI